MAVIQNQKRSSHAGGAAIALAAMALSMLFVISRSASALADAPDAIVEVKATTDQVLSILQNPEYKRATESRRQRLRDAVADHFDFRAMARSALGVHWKGLQPDEREHFVALFTRFVEASYIGKIESYSGQRIEYVKETSDDPGYAQVNTIIAQDGKEPIPINYRLTLDGTRWRVYDVTIDQISLVANYRNQFNRVINNQGYRALIDDLDRKQRQIEAGT
jgi:phospholipid transport system substrate-binding protein